MFARVSTYEIPPHQAREAEESFEQALGQIRALKGLEAGYLLMNPETGRVVTMTLWDSAATMEASHVTASRLRTEAGADRGRQRAQHRRIRGRGSRARRHRLARVP